MKQRSHTLLSFISLSLGTASGQIVALVALPFISRLYDPEEFGSLALIIAVSSMILPAVGLKFDFALLIPSDRRTLRTLIGLAIISVFGISAIWSVFVQIFTYAFTENADIKFFGFWVFLVTSTSGLFNVFAQLAIRENEYQKVGKSAFLQSSTTAFTQTSFGFIVPNLLGLLSGILVGQISSLLYLFINFRKDIGRYSINDLHNSLKEYWRFPALFAPSAILNSLGIQLPIIAISIFFGLDAVGQLAMADKIVGVPIALIAGPISQIFVGELAKSRREKSNKYTSYFLRTTLVLAVCSTLLFGTLFFCAEWLVPLILGPKWVSIISLVQIMCIFGLIRLTFSPTTIALTIFELAKGNLIFDVLRLLLISSAVLIIYVTNLDFIVSVVLLFSSLALTYLASWIYVWISLHKINL